MGTPLPHDLISGAISGSRMGDSAKVVRAAPVGHVNRASCRSGAPVAQPNTRICPHSALQPTTAVVPDPPEHVAWLLRFPLLWFASISLLLFNNFHRNSSRHVHIDPLPSYTPSPPVIEPSPSLLALASPPSIFISLSCARPTPLAQDQGSLGSIKPFRTPFVASGIGCEPYIRFDVDGFP
jgi:hypothetical protein